MCLETAALLATRPSMPSHGPRQGWAQFAPWWVPEPPRATPPAMRGGAHTAGWGSTLGGHQWSPHPTPHIGNTLLEGLNQPLGALILMMLSPLPPT